MKKMLKNLIATIGVALLMTGSVFAADVAKIGDVSYATLQAAIDAAQSGETIVVLTDIALAEGVVIASDDVITIDLNGKTISRNTETTVSTAAITNNGNLTIQDSSTEKTGKVTAFAEHLPRIRIPVQCRITRTTPLPTAEC